MSVTTKFKFLSEIGSSIWHLALNCFLYNYNSLHSYFHLDFICVILFYFLIFIWLHQTLVSACGIFNFFKW